MPSPRRWPVEWEADFCFAIVLRVVESAGWHQHVPEERVLLRRLVQEYWQGRFTVTDNLKALLNTTGERRKLTGTGARTISVLAIITSVYQIWQCTFSTMQPLMHYAIHLALMLMLGYLVYTPCAGCDKKRFAAPFDVFMAVVAIASGFYYASQVGWYIDRWPMVDELGMADVVAGIAIVLLVLEATRRTMGKVLPIIALLFLGYALFGHYMPGFLYHREIAAVDVLDQLVFTINGVYSSPIAVAATFVYLFVLFGSFFANSGAGDFFYKFSMAVAGRYPGGAAKVAIVASALFGTINGSPTANVVTTGSFTIPMMKRIGYPPLFAGSVEAVASTGGGMLPPIMGTAAFLMVEMAGIPYAEIALAAALPGIVYYLALGFMVHFRAKKEGLSGVDPKELPPLGKTLREGFQFMIPLVVLVVMLFAGYTPSLTAVAGIVAVVIVSWMRKDTRMGLAKILKALEDGAVSSIVITLSCAIAGVVIGGLMTTGLSGKIASLIMTVGGETQFIALLMTAALCTLLGMGMPVAAAYALTAALAVPSLYKLGIPPMAAHLFVVYFATLSAITPPVAVAAYAAAGIAEADASKIGWTAVRLGAVSFIVPFIFVYDQGLLISAATIGPGTLWIICTSILGCYALSAASEGWLTGPLRHWQRAVLLVAGLMTLYPEKFTDLVGIGLFVVVYFCTRKSGKNRPTGENSGVGEKSATPGEIKQ
jgi:TRAP transporter 4TM/12TM fusion protein